jgi:ribosome assembly protein YihI (activator of Der GTPase)
VDDFEKYEIDQESDAPTRARKKEKRTPGLCPDLSPQATPGNKAEKENTQNNTKIKSQKGPAPCSSASQPHEISSRESIVAYIYLCRFLRPPLINGFS